ncbi:hypothetical protein NYY89_20390, partial [Acinetobacter baumannii]|nr:hypothetical protein [Acinetobacter baumannii]
IMEAREGSRDHSQPGCWPLAAPVTQWHKNATTRQGRDKDSHLAHFFPCFTSDIARPGFAAGRGPLLHPQPQAAGLRARGAGALSATMERSR